MAYPRVGLRKRVYGAIVRRSNRRRACAGLARRRTRVADGHLCDISQCMVERQIHRSLRREIPAASSEEHPSSLGQHRSFCMGYRLMRTFDACAGRGSWHRGSHWDSLSNESIPG